MLMVLCGTLWAYAFYHIVCRSWNEAFWQTNFGDRLTFDTESTSAYLTMEMRMRVVVMSVVIAAAEFVFYSIATILYNMHDMMLAKQC